MKFAFIDAEKMNHSLEFLCLVLDVCKSGFHAWKKRPPSPRKVEDEEIKSTMRKIHKGPRKAYGSPRMCEELRQKYDIHISRRRTARLMKEEGLHGTPKKRFVNTTLSNHDYAIAPNLLAREFDVLQPNQVWAGDITYIPTAEGYCYLAVVLDLFSRRVVGWAMADHMRAELVCDALQQALDERDAPTIFHSDQGSQYASYEFQRLLAKYGIRSSMSRRGNCWDNAPVESFFRSLKHEGLGDFYRDLAEAKLDVFAYIEAFYNTERLHSTLGYTSPNNYEALAA